MGYAQHKRQAAGSSKGDKIKLALAGGLFFVAIGLIGFSQGWFDGLFWSPPKVDPIIAKATQQASDDAKKEIQQRIEKGEVTVGGE